MLGLFLFSTSLVGQGLTLPPSGANQKSTIIQHMGLATVTINYSSPDVTAPDGTDRKGQIWGKLVPYGMNNLGFGTAKESPWRAGANENTTISFSHDVKIQGKSLKAGTYGFHIVPQEQGKDWTLIFSKNSTAWGSYFYDPNDDALKVSTKPEKTEHNEWLMYGFSDRELAACTAYLAWESMKVPFRIEVSNMMDLYIENLARELQGTATGFTWQGWNTAANFCLNNNTHLEQGLEWADASISAAFIGQENYTTLSTKAALLNALKRTEESEKVMEQAVAHPTATVFQIHNYGRQLLASGNKEKAMEIFEMNAKRFPDTWPVNVGLGRAYSALGKYKKALKHMELAYNNAPQEFNKNNVKGHIDKLKKGEDIN